MSSTVLARIQPNSLPERTNLRSDRRVADPQRLRSVGTGKAVTGGDAGGFRNVATRAASSKLLLVEPRVRKQKHTRAVVGVVGVPRSS